MRALYCALDRRWAVPCIGDGRGPSAVPPLSPSLHRRRARALRCIPLLPCIGDRRGPSAASRSFPASATGARPPLHPAPSLHRRRARALRCIPALPCIGDGRGPSAASRSFPASATGARPPPHPGPSLHRRRARALYCTAIGIAAHAGPEQYPIWVESPQPFLFAGNDIASAPQVAPALRAPSVRDRAVRPPTFALAASPFNRRYRCPVAAMTPPRGRAWSHHVSARRGVILRHASCNPGVAAPLLCTQRPGPLRPRSAHRAPATCRRLSPTTHRLGAPGVVVAVMGASALRVARRGRPRASPTPFVFVLRELQQADVHTCATSTPMRCARPVYIVLLYTSLHVR